MIFSLLPVKDGLVPSMDQLTGSSESSISTYSPSASPTKAMPFHCYSAFWTNEAIPIGRNARLSWNDSSDFLDMTASTALWPTESLSAKSGLTGLTTTGFDTISVFGRICGLSSPPQEKESECGGSSTPSKSDRRNSTTSSFCIKGSMSISPEVGSRTLTGYQNFRF